METWKKWRCVFSVRQGFQRRITRKQALLDDGADIEVIDRDGMTALDWALVEERTEVAKVCHELYGRFIVAGFFCSI